MTRRARVRRRDPDRWRGLRRHPGSRLWQAAGGVVAARLALVAARAVAAPGWGRENFRGERVSLAGGPALAAAASAAAASGATGPATRGAALVAGLAAGGVGLYDDLVGQRPEHRAKGLRGHGRALRQGRVTSGTVKVAGLAAAGLAAAALLERAAPPPSGGRLLRLVTGAGVVAGSANLLNLLDLRPGRALKVGLVAGGAMAGGPAGGLAAGPAGACLGMLPDDLRERSMLGDSGANALGALLGVALAARTGAAGRAGALAVLAALTLASERVSYTRVIAGTPVLRELDRLGRRPEG